jgi:hypothetical protein
VSTQVTIQTTDGRILNGINYTVSPVTTPANPAALAASMQGGMAYGVYHLHAANGWVYIPASQIAAVLSIRPGALT